MKLLLQLATHKFVSVRIFAMKIVFQDPTFSLQLLRAIGQTYYGGADIGECLSTAYRIKEGNFESWYAEWLNTAQRVHRYAEESMLSGHKISAKDGFLRASNYYRVAEFLLVEPEDQRILDTWQKSKECFKKATELFDTPVESIEIPYGEGTLPGHFYSVDTSKNPRSTLIVHGGFDSTLEELYTFAAAPALQRGYNCLTFEGPGQGAVIIKDKIPFRFDWEKVVAPVVDYALSRNEVDPIHIALMGISMGGYLAARACAFEHRISACILYNGVYDGKQALETSFPKSLKKAYEDGNEGLVNMAIEILMESDSNLKFNIKHGMWTTGSSTPFELIKKSTSFTMDGIIQNIRCPTLVLDAEKDDSFPGQPQKVYHALKCPKNYILFTETEGAEEHCQSGASSLSNQRIFDWLDQTFKNH
jgi:pimeloyl-ACP methyl ester carboxylesterase